jgi:CheY-like chemotaxis protein
MAPDGEGLTVLLVEDDGLIRMSTLDILTDLGHRVIEAGNAAEALAHLAREPIDLLLTDIGLPGMSGHELAVEARRRVPALRVIFASGKDEASGGADEAPLDGVVLLPKPYAEADIARAIGAAIASG